MLLNPNGSIISLRNSLLFFTLHFNTPIHLIQIQLILGEKKITCLQSVYLHFHETVFKCLRYKLMPSA